MARWVHRYGPSITKDSLTEESGLPPGKIVTVTRTDSVVDVEVDGVLTSAEAQDLARALEPLEPYGKTPKG